jgi:hypothetical protein
MLCLKVPLHQTLLQGTIYFQVKSTSLTQDIKFSKKSSLSRPRDFRNFITLDTMLLLDR